MKKSKFKSASLFMLLFCLGSIAIPSSAAGTLTLHLPLDEAAQSTIFYDVSGNDKDGTCSGDSCPTAGVIGKDGRALSFDGDDYVEVPYDASLNPASFTVMAWAKVTGGAGTYRSVVTSRGDGYGYLIYATAANEWQFWMGHGLGWEYLGNTPVTEGAWTHLAGVYDGDTGLMQFYVDGNAAGSLSNRVLSPNPQWPLRVGAGTTEEAAKYFFHGLIDDVRLYDAALSQAEIQAAMTNTPAVDTCFVETTGDDETDDASPNASALQTAIDNASPGALIKVAGTCAGVQNRDSKNQTVYVGQSVTLQGGYTTTHWLADPDPTTYATTLDAEDAGRVMYIPSGITVTVDGFTIRRGTGSQGFFFNNGGGIYNAGTLTLTHSIVTTNTGNLGGGLYNHRTSPMISDVIFDDNAASQGGGMFNEGYGGESSPTLVDVVFSNNVAQWGEGAGGGGMFNSGYAGGVSSPILMNVTFRNNSARDYGGGMRTYAAGGTVRPTLTNVIFQDNTAPEGGALYIESGDGSWSGDVGATIINGLFDSNGANHISYDDAAIGTQPHFINCTFYGAESQAVYISAFDDGQTPIDFTNCIFWGNKDDLTNNDAALNVQYSIVEESGGYPGTGNLYTDPDFTAAANGNFVPLYSSPAIDMGDNAVCPATDLRDAPRADWGCDAGAYEVQLSDTVMINKGVTGPGTYTFGPTQARIQVHNTGGCLNGLEVQRVPHSHPYASAPLQTGAYWSITPPSNCTSGFTVTLTLPFASANSTSRLCRWLGGTGPGDGWDCDDGTYTNFDDVNGWVIRSNVTGFSDWAVGNDVGPTAVTLADLGACSTPAWLPALSLIVLGGLVLVRRRRR